MKNNEIVEMSQVDLVIDPNASDLDKYSAKIPVLYSKYADLLMKEKMALHKTKRELRKLYRVKFEYYSGKAVNPHPLKILKSDLKTYIESDEEYSKLAYVHGCREARVGLLEDLVDAVKQKGWSIKSIIEWRKFTGGVQ